MKLKLVKFPIAAVDDDLTIGQWYDCVEPYEGSDHYDVIDDAGDEHEVEKVCFETMEDRSAEWSGEGLPPIGTVCEILGTASGSWSEGVIDYIDSKHCIWHWLDGSQETIHNGVCSMQFRPIKSQEEIEKERVVKEISESISFAMDYVNSTEEIADYLYKIGYRKTT